MKALKLYFSIFLFFLFSIDTPQAAEYIAFSLKVAQKKILTTPKDKSYRKTHPEVFNLAGITKIKGFVYNRSTSDVILVGMRDPECAILTLDDFVVALRARFIHGKCPLVTIDRSPETEKMQLYVVHFEGGIENTQFAKDLLNAYCLLIRLAYSYISTGLEGVKSYRELSMDFTSRHSTALYQITRRFWIYPKAPLCAVRKDVVIIKRLKIGIHAGTLSAKIDGKKIMDQANIQDTSTYRFAKLVSENFEELSKRYRFFSKLQGLYEIVALTNAIDFIKERPDLIFWLNYYQAKNVRTVRKINLLKWIKAINLPEISSQFKAYKESSDSNELIANPLEFNINDITLLKAAVLQARPSSLTLSWSFITEISKDNLIK